MASDTPNDHLPLTSFSLVLGAAPTLCSPGPAPNTRTIFLTNRTLDAALLRVHDFLLGAPVMSSANSMVIPPTSTVVLEIGPEGERLALTTGGSDRLVIWLQSEDPAKTPTLNITYGQCRGYVGPISRSGVWW